MGLNELHDVMFNAHILYMAALGIWAAVLAARNMPISGNYWGSVATSVFLALAITIVGVIMYAQGLRPGERAGTYFLYMLFLVTIMPGLFSLLRGRDDRNAAIAFSILALFNATTSLSMWQRSLVSPWY